MRSFLSCYRDVSDSTIHQDLTNLYDYDSPAHQFSQFAYLHCYCPLEFSDQKGYVTSQLRMICVCQWWKLYFLGMNLRLNSSFLTFEMREIIHEECDDFLSRTIQRMQPTLIVCTEGYIRDRYNESSSAWWESHDIYFILFRARIVCENLLEEIGWTVPIELVAYRSPQRCQVLPRFCFAAIARAISFL